MIYQVKSGKIPSKEITVECTKTVIPYSFLEEYKKEVEDIKNSRKQRPTGAIED